MEIKDCLIYARNRAWEIGDENIMEEMVVVPIEDFANMNIRDFQNLREQAKEMYQQMINRRLKINEKSNSEVTT